ncbi:MAG: hypothetical protein ACI3Z8_05350 [Paludibacteraceae bacterium]
MALIKCPECGATYSEYSPACLQCGYPTEKAKERGAERIEEAQTPISQQEPSEWSSQARIQTAQRGRLSEDLHAITTEDVHTNTSPTRLIETKLSLHWIVEAYIFLSIIFSIVQCYNAFSKQLGALVLTIFTLIVGVYVIFAIGILFVKKWALICLFSFRFINMIIAVIALALDPSLENEFYKEIVKTLILIGIFFIRKDGYSAYRALWCNGKKMVEIPDERQK